jgi:YfiR/HmsC-like
MRKIKHITFLFLFLTGNLLMVSFEEKDTTSMIKANYIYNFAKLVDWPVGSKKGNFVISVLGNSNVYKELVKKYSSKTIGSQPIEIKKINNTGNISKCHVLYIEKEFNPQLNQIIKTLENTDALIVTDKTGALSQGSAINFTVQDNNLKFEVSIGNALKHKLFIGSTLKSLALYVEN